MEAAMRLFIAINRIGAAIIGVALYVTLFVAGLNGQRVGAIRGWFSSPDCVDKSESEEQVEAIEDHDEGLLGFADQVQGILTELPDSGRAKELASELQWHLKGILEYTCKDEDSGQYVVRYPMGLGTEFVSDTEFDRFTIDVASLSAPEVEFDAKWLPEERVFKYSYQLFNRADARQSIWSLFLVIDVSDDSATLHHPVWRSDSKEVLAERPAAAAQAALFPDLHGPELRHRTPEGKWAGWRRVSYDEPLPPGQSLDSFTVTSRFRPGWTTAYVEGNKYMSLPWRENGIPSAVYRDTTILQREENMFSSLLVVGPVFSPSDLPATVGANWRRGLTVLVERGWLSDSSPYIAAVLDFLRMQEMASDALGFEIEPRPTDPIEVRLDAIIRLLF